MIGKNCKCKKIKKIIRAMISCPQRLFNGISFRAIVVDSSVHKKAKLLANVDFRYSTIGKYSYIAEQSVAIYSNIGSFCSIADKVVFEGGTRNISDVSSSPIFENDPNLFGIDLANIDFD